MKLAWFLIAVTSAFLAALFSFPGLNLERRRRAVALAALAVPVALAPLSIPPTAPFLRLVAAMYSTALLVKLHDLHIAAKRSLRPSFFTFLAFLPNIFSVVWRRLDAEPQPTFRQNLLRLGQSLWRTSAAAVILIWLFRVRWTAPYFVEHCAKATALALLLIPGSSLAATLWRLAGGRARDFMKAPLLAPTPAEFWRRYNRPAHQYFSEDIFKPAGGLRSPLRATLLTFVFSALIHEYVFAIPIGRVQGYQTVFFLLQGLAVAATRGLRPKGWRIWLGIAATFIFNLTAGVFFFASINGVGQFYSRGLPGWLAGW